MLHPDAIGRTLGLQTKRVARCRKQSSSSSSSSLDQECLRVVGPVVSSVCRPPTLLTQLFLFETQDTRRTISWAWDRNIKRVLGEQGWGWVAMGGLKGARNCVFSAGRPRAVALSWHVFFPKSWNRIGSVNLGSANIKPPLLHPLGSGHLLLYPGKTAADWKWPVFPR